MSNRCPHCPAPEGLPCPGERARRLCRLADPAHPDHDPAYLASIPEAARQMADSGRGFPPVTVQAAGLARSLWNWATSGFALSDEAERARRLGICAACPELERGRCRACGCVVDAKARIRVEPCPLGRW